MNVMVKSFNRKKRERPSLSFEYIAKTRLYQTFIQRKQVSDSLPMKRTLPSSFTPPTKANTNNECKSDVSLIAGDGTSKQIHEISH